MHTMKQYSLVIVWLDVCDFWEVWNGGGVVDNVGRVEITLCFRSCLTEAKSKGGALWRRPPSHCLLSVPMIFGKGGCLPAPCFALNWWKDDSVCGTLARTKEC